MVQERKRVPVPVEPNPRQVIPIRPILGMWTVDAGRDAPRGSSPDMLNCTIIRGFLVKRPGFIQYKPGSIAMDGEIIGLFSTQTNDNTSHLIAVTPESVYRFDNVTDEWIQLTGATLNGDEPEVVSFELSQNKIAFTNQVDKIQLIDPVGLTYADLDAGAPICRFLTRFNGRLNAGSTTEGALPLPFRHRRPVRDDHTDWTGLGSGFRDQAEFPAHMRGMRKLGNGMAIYYERAIEISIANPNADAPFTYEGRVTEEGLYAPFTLAGRNNLHFGVGVSQIWEFNGSQLSEIMGQVRDTIFKSLNATNVKRMFGIAVYDSQEYLAFIADASSLNPNTIWAWNWQRQTAVPWSVVGFRCATTHRLDDALTIDELVGTMDEQNWEFDSQQTLQAYPALLVGATNGKVYRFSELANGDDDLTIEDQVNPIPCRWTSHDFTSENVFNVPGRDITLERLSIEYQATGTVPTFNVSYSRDGGISWDGLYQPEATVSSGLATAHLTDKFTGGRIRFKIEHSSATESFRISKFEVEIQLLGTKVHAA